MRSSSKIIKYPESPLLPESIIFYKKTQRLIENITTTTIILLEEEEEELKESH